ncbi:MAG: 2-hydroxyacyl-CoA dehydratase [Planctomycetes bacterium]|nr:2-hydroxyacyl-CoA dehydratase [Planctomycetota bacterium]MBM4079495.1 2-hydroxyacyl-CoA dehydratase [Planctomycetota bacterium]MBM4085650.1 2-hydroxyacyl-CoA dehydratase [Planctomycetota bacterium]
MDNIAYFRTILTSDQRERELKEFPGKVVGTFCNFVPEELIHAVGAQAVRLCAGHYEAAKAAEAVLPRDLCPVIKSSAGLLKSGGGFFGRVDLVVIPVSCDGKKKLGETIGRVKPVHMMHLPASKAARAGQDQWLAEVTRLAEVLEALSGVKITRERLRAAIELLNRRQDAFKRLFELRQLHPPRITGLDALFVTGASFHDDVRRWTDKVQALCQQLEGQQRRGADGEHSPRILLTGAPLIHPNFKLVEIIEVAGAVIVIDELCSGTQRLYNPVIPRDWTLKEMLRAVAEKCLLPSTCPCFVESGDRLNRVTELAQAFRVDGVIYHNLRMCQLFDMERASVKQVLSHRGLPMLDVQTDYTHEDFPQLKTRVEAFIELLRARRHEPAR